MWNRFNFAPSLNMLGYANMRLGKMEAAEEAFDDYIYNNAMHPNPYDSMGEYWQNMKQFETAYNYYMMAYTMDSTFTISKERAEALENKNTPIK